MRTTKRLGLLLPVSTLVWLMLSSPRTAAQPTMDGQWLRWNAPPGCVERAEVERLLGPSRQMTQLDLDGAIQRDRAGYALHLSVRRGGQHFERTLRAQSCDELAESIVFLVDLAATQLSAAEPPAKQEPQTKSEAPTPSSASGVTMAAEDDAEPDASYLSTAVPQIT